MPGPNYDNILKHIAMQAPDAFFAWLAHIVGIAAAVVEDSSLSTELPMAVRYVDLAWLIRAGDERVILHIEFQLEPDEKMRERLLGYQARLIEKYTLPVISVVIWLKKTTNIPTSPAVWSWQGLEINRCVFQTIKLWEQPAEDLLNIPNPYLWPIAGLMAKTTGASVVQVGHKIAEAPVEASVKSDLVGYLWFLAGIQLKAAALQAAFRRHPLINELWKHSSTAQELAAEKLAEGRTEARREDARLVLEERFTTLSEDIIQAINQADEPTLREVIKHAYSDSLEQLEVRLGLRK